MDPEIFLNDREESGDSHSGYLHFSHSPYDHHRHPFSTYESPLQEELDLYELSERGAGQFCPPELHLIRAYEPVPLRGATVTEMFPQIANSDRTHTLTWTQMDFNTNQQFPHYLSPSLMMGPTQAQESPFGLNFLPGVCPSPLPVLSPGSMVHHEFEPVFPELILSPRSLRDSSWLETSPVSSTPNSKCSFFPYMFVPCSQFIPPHSLLLLPEVHPSWCMCPRVVDVDLNCSPELLPRHAGDSVSQNLKASEKERSEEKSEDQRSEVYVQGQTDKQKNEIPDKDKLQANKTYKKTTISRSSPLLFLDEEMLAERAFEEYMMIMDSLFPEILESYKETDNEEDEGEEDQNLETENGSFLEYLDKLCSDVDFVRTVNTTLNIDYLDSLLSTDPEPLDLFAREKQDQQVTLQEQPHHLSADSSRDPVPDACLEDELVLQQQSHPLSADPNGNSLTAETSLATAVVEERAQSPISFSASTQSDPNPKHNGQHAPQSCFPLLPSRLLEETLPTAATPEHYNPANVSHPICHYDSFFMDHRFAPSPDSSLTFHFEESDFDKLSAILFAADIDLDVSEDTLLASLHLADIQSHQLSQKIQSGPLLGDIHINDSPSNSSVSEQNENPPAVDPKTPAPSLRADLSSQSADPPVLSVTARERLSQPLPQTSARTRKHEKHCEPKNIKSKSHEHHCTVPVSSNTSSVADSYPQSCDRQVDCDSPGMVPDKQILEAPKGLQASQESASSGISSKIRTGEFSKTGRKSQKKVSKDARIVTPEPAAISGREMMIVKSINKMKGKKEGDGVINVVNMRKSQRPSGQTEKDKTIKNVKSIEETAENRKQTQKSVKKTVKFTAGDGLIYEKQKRQSSGERQLCVREWNNLQEQRQGAETANTVSHSSEMGKNKHQKQVKLEAEAGKQCVASNTLENVLLFKTEEKKETCERRVKCKEDGMMGRRTISLTEDLTGSRATENLKHSEMKRSKIKPSPSTDMLDKQDNNVKGNTNKHPLCSPIEKGRRNANKDLTARKINKVEVSENCRSSSQSESSLQDTNTITADQGRQKAAAHKIHKSKHPTPSLKLPSLKKSKKSLKYSPHPESIQLPHKQSERVARSEAIEGRHKAETWDLDCLTSSTQKPKVSKQVINSKEIHKNKHSEVSHRSSSPSQTAQVRAENGKISQESTRPTLSPSKRFYQESESSQESETTETSGNKTEMQSPSKKAKLKSKQLTPTKLRIKRF